MESSVSNLHFLKQFFDRMEDGIFVFSGSGKLLDLNPAGAELIGYTSQELLKISFSKISNVASTLPEKLKLKERSEWFLDTFSSKDGTSKTMFCQALKIKGEEGQETSYWLHVRLPKSNETSQNPGAGTEIGWEVLERFFDMNPLPMAITEIETGKYLKVNQQFCIQVKYSEEEILGKSGVELGFWSSPETRTEIIEAIKKKGFVRDLEIRFMNRLGEEFWGLFSAHPIEFGGSLKLLTVTVPITDRVREEFEKQKLLEEFKENQEILSQIIRLNPTAITLSRADGTYLEANDLFLEFVGKTREEVIGKTPVELGVYYDLEDRELIRGLLTQKGVVENLEVKMGSPGGKIRSILFSARVLETGGERKILAIGHDITHIKEAQEDLRNLASELEKSKELFQKLFQLIPSYVVLTDLVSKKVVDVNERFMEFVKVTREQVVGKETIELPVWDNDPETRVKIYNQLMEKGEINNIETIFTSTDGTSIPVLYSGRVINLNGRPHVISLGTDISERAKAEAEAKRLNEEVRHNKELFEKIFQMNPAAVSLSDLETGTYMQVNEAYCELIGYTKEQIIGRTSFQLGIWKTNLDRAKIRKELEEVGWSKNVEAAINHSDGSERHVISGNRVFMLGNKMVLLALLIDITDKKKVESERDQYLAQLEESKDLFEKVFDMNPDTVTISDLETGKYINVNSMFHELMQYNKEEAIGRTVVELGIWADPEQRAKLVKQLKETGILRDIDVSFRRKDNTIVDTIFSARTVNLLGRPALVAISKDNTLAKAVAREKEEEARRLSEQTRMLLDMATDPDFASGNMESGLKHLVQMCTKTLECDRASIWLFGGKGGERLTLAIGWDRKYNEFMKPAFMDLSGYPNYLTAIKSERFVDAMDVVHDPRTKEFAESYSIPLEIDSLLDSPIFLRGELHGVICLEHRGGQRKWKGYEQQFVVTVAEQVTQLTLNSERREAKEELEVAVRTRTSELASALDNLRKTQDQLILSEKMAALGQLVAGIAHEINNPLGAISALSGELRAYLDSSPERLEKLGPNFAKAEPKYIKKLSEFIRQGIKNKETVVSREERRNILKQLKNRLSNMGFENSYDLADRLMDVGMYSYLDEFSEIFSANSNLALLDFAIEEIQTYKNAASIRLAVDRTSKIVYALKSFAHIDSGGGKIDTDLAENIETVLTIYHNQIKNGVEVELDFQARPIIPAYPDDLIQVWTNLIYNSLQAMQFKGKIKISIQDSNSDVSVSISDNGPGIPPEIKAKIFDPFYTTKAPGEGSGLGLDISRRIVLKHGGRIEFSSKPGKTVFKVILPKT
ncbi:PAS domain S-box protein [Leptospira langatensis]|uniref:histidine kinase n=1 Tax=Leptospira langatensis TaxID=2484983 RepID=A0A5F1ZVG5_9LEPT|nr:PAS domain S-box protein [Leptospira langatensis]TGK03240.1 PAS domain S-box protein [Leptospira langatensis]TGL42414.1 PAS domain S-box protein [Leptospira langatensis]